MIIWLNGGHLAPPRRGRGPGAGWPMGPAPGGGQYPQVIGQDPAGLRSFYGELFGWEFDTSSPVAEEVSEPENYGFADPGRTGDGAGIPGGVGGGAAYDPRVIFYIGVPDVEAALLRAESLGGTRRMGPARAPRAWRSGTSPTPRAT